MLGLLTHPIACFIYLFAIQIVIRKTLGEIRSTSGYIGRVSLFLLGSLAVFGSVTLIGQYRLGGGDPESNLGVYLALILIIVPAVLLVVALAGTLAAVLTKRYERAFGVSTCCMIGMLSALLLRMHGGL